MDLDKLSTFLTKYFRGLGHPIIKEEEARILVEEIVAGVEVLLNKPEISYDDWWDELHALCDDLEE